MGDKLVEDSAAVRAAVEQAERFKDLELGQVAILGHCERIEEHLRILNGRTQKNEDGNANTRALIVTHITEVEARRETQRLADLEVKVEVIEKAAEADGAVKKTRQRDWALVTAIFAAIISPTASLAVALIRG